MEAMEITGGSQIVVTPGRWKAWNFIGSQNLLTQLVEAMEF
jgi:hypothetical protein